MSSIRRCKKKIKNLLSALSWLVIAFLTLILLSSCTKPSEINSVPCETLVCPTCDAEGCVWNAAVIDRACGTKCLEFYSLEG